MEMSDLVELSLHLCGELRIRFGELVENPPTQQVERRTIGQFRLPWMPVMSELKAGYRLDLCEIVPRVNAFKGEARTRFVEA